MAADYAPDLVQAEHHAPVEQLFLDVEGDRSWHQHHRARTLH
jgi:hypothetical protein